MNIRWKHSKATIYNIGYHLIWCPKYRRRVLVKKVEIRLKELLLEKAGQMEIEIRTMEIMPDVGYQAFGHARIIVNL
ncbi:MAG TPA: transposase [Anaerovoracaceae bacterium]|nr:transposase [Anaerovoracaceae bacterium]